MTIVSKLHENQRKKERLAHANPIIKAMSDHGRRFFYNEADGEVAHFLFDGNNQLRFCDDYIQKPFIVKVGKCWNRHFHHGGTMERLVEALAIYIREGKPIHPGHFGPWRNEICDGDLWGYGHDEMEKLRAEISGNPAIAIYEERKAA
jgi:hypothetical protein